MNAPVAAVPVSAGRIPGKLGFSPGEIRRHESDECHMGAPAAAPPASIGRGLGEFGGAAGEIQDMRSRNLV